MFLYPITFGLVSTVFLTKPWIRSVNYLRDLCLSDDQEKRRIGFQNVVLIIVTILLVTGISGSFSSIPAIWSFAPEVLDRTDVYERVTAEKIRTKIMNRCEQINLNQRLEAPFLQYSLAGQWKMSDAPLSHTEVFYRIGHLAMTILFCLLFTTGSLFAAPPAEIERSEAKVLEHYVWIALFFASFWILMRATFLFEEQSLYGENPLLKVYGVFLILFAVLFGLLPFLRTQHS